MSLYYENSNRKRHLTFRANNRLDEKGTDTFHSYIIFGVFVVIEAFECM